MPERLGANIIHDYEKLGDKVAEWAKDQTTWPEGEEVSSPDGFTAKIIKDPAKVAAFKEFLTNSDLVTLPDRIEKVLFIQPDNSSYIVRIPPGDLVQQSEDDAGDPGEQYVLPGFYERKIKPAGAPPIGDLELLHSRIGDYTFAHCM